MNGVLRSMIERSGALESGPEVAAAVPREQCGLCGLPIPPEHRHVLDLGRHEIHCACRACALLFDRSGAGGRHYRLIPDTCRTLGFTISDVEWRGLGIPVQMAFFVRGGEPPETRAFYPSPAGTTAAELPVDVWLAIEANNPGLAGVEPEVEALLVNRIGGSTRAYIVGLDDCYRLVGVVRQNWHGFGGGDEVWREIERFFTGLDHRAEVSEPPRPNGVSEPRRNEVSEPPRRNG